MIQHLRRDGWLPAFLPWQNFRKSSGLRDLLGSRPFLLSSAHNPLKDGIVQRGLRTS